MAATWAGLLRLPGCVADAEREARAAPFVPRSDGVPSRPKPHRDAARTYVLDQPCPYAPLRGDGRMAHHPRREPRATSFWPCSASASALGEPGSDRRCRSRGSGGYAADARSISVLPGKDPADEMDRGSSALSRRPAQGKPAKMTAVPGQRQRIALRASNLSTAHCPACSAFQPAGPLHEGGQFFIEIQQ